MQKVWFAPDPVMWPPVTLMGWPVVGHQLASIE